MIEGIRRLAKVEQVVRSISPQGHRHGEEVIYSHRDGETLKIAWNGESQMYDQIARGKTKPRVITSKIDAIATGCEISQNGSSKINPWIEPCVKYANGRSIVCPYLDSTKMVCKNPEDLIPQNGGVDCPDQKGQLTFISVEYK